MGWFGKSNESTTCYRKRDEYGNPIMEDKKKGTKQWTFSIPTYDPDYYSGHGLFF